MGFIKDHLRNIKTKIENSNNELELKWLRTTKRISAQKVKKIWKYQITMLNSLKPLNTRNQIYFLCFMKKAINQWVYAVKQANNNWIIKEFK